MLATDVQIELDRVSQALTGRIKQLAERYAMPVTRAARADQHSNPTCAVGVQFPPYSQTHSP